MRHSTFCIYDTACLLDRLTDGNIKWYVKLNNMAPAAYFIDGSIQQHIGLGILYNIRQVIYHNIQWYIELGTVWYWLFVLQTNRWQTAYKIKIYKFNRNY